MADERAIKAGILNDFDVSIGKIRQLVQERETNGNSLMKTITDNIYINPKNIHRCTTL